MQISNNYIVVIKDFPAPQEGEFKVVEVQDDFIYRGRVKLLGEAPIFMGNKQVTVGDVVLFAKYSPDTHEIEHEGEKLKFVSTADILAVL